MAKYTLELYQMLQDKNFNLFDFDYDFYCDNDSIKRNFEAKFEHHYLFHEIGAETIQRFKLMLQSRLNIIMPYYQQLYITELRCRNIDFMVNKDYTESVIRELQSVNENNIASNSSTQSNSVDRGKESNINNGVSNVSITNALTGENEIKSNSDNTDISNQKSKHNGNELEKITNTGKGNIGITSSADLLKGWREVIINLDKLIIDECYDLFMLVY